MAGKAMKELGAELGGKVPTGLEALREEELRDLRDAIRAARRRQAEALADAGERALERIPRLLRGPVRRVVG